MLLFYAVFVYFHCCPKGLAGLNPMGFWGIPNGGGAMPKGGYYYYCIPKGGYYCMPKGGC